ncbi:general stress protein [Actinotignum urinale]|uniref:general stress protein n=1 Tax=Actinotignum urinale TaxID=190146 RepID=UPI00370D05DD
MTQQTFHRRSHRIARERDDYKTITEVRRYEEAEKTVSDLAHTNFPIHNVRIVGINLESVEQIMGRYSVAKNAISAIFSALLWFVFSFFVLQAFLYSITVEILAICGAFALTFGLLTFFNARRNTAKRGYISLQGMQANSYEIQVRSAYVNAAYHALANIGYRFGEESN